MNDRVVSALVMFIVSARRDGEDRACESSNYEKVVNERKNLKKEGGSGVASGVEERDVVRRYCTFTNT